MFRFHGGIITLLLRMFIDVPIDNAVVMGSDAAVEWAEISESG